MFVEKSVLVGPRRSQAITAVLAVFDRLGILSLFHLVPILSLSLSFTFFSLPVSPLTYVVSL